jgi:uncharacterized protein involved in exopolysaccharide biosynthesis
MQEDFDQEIDLAKYLTILIKRKTLILTIFFVSVAATTVINLQLPKVWSISMIIEPSMLSDVLGGNLPNARLLDTPGNIKARIESGAFDFNVVKALQLDPKTADLKLAVSQSKDTTFLKLSIEKQDKDKELGIKILNQFFIELGSFYKETVDLKKDAIDKQISVVLNNIKSKRDSIKLTEENLKIVEAREIDLLNELKETKANTEQLLAKRNVLLERKAQGDDISSLLYLNTIQQNMSYFNQLNNQLAGNKTNKENMVNAIKTVQTDINNQDIEIEKLKTAKDSVRNITMVQEPRISPRPIDPQRRRNVMLAGITGLMIGIILVFFLEYINTSRKVLNA